LLRERAELGIPTPLSYSVTEKGLLKFTWIVNEMDQDARFINLWFRESGVMYDSHISEVKDRNDIAYNSQ
jgi:hypothetical protein